MADFLKTCISRLEQYPKDEFGSPACMSWDILIEGLSIYRPPTIDCVIAPERKWELVSAFQKSIRRGDKQTVHRLVSAMKSMPQEYAYFWKRLCVIACEDIGPADDVLVKFVVACSMVFTPKKTGALNFHVICFLAEHMCDLNARSRIYCSMAIVDLITGNSTADALLPEDSVIIDVISQRKTEVEARDGLMRSWQRKNDWRAMGLLKFVGLSLPFLMTRDPRHVSSSPLLFDLPSCSYDMYTRIGLETLKRLVIGVEGGEAVRDFFREHPVKNSHKVLGDALFFIEGGRIEGELAYAQLCSLEQRLSARQYGLPFQAWLNLQELTRACLEDGIVDRVREEVLHQNYSTIRKSFAILPLFPEAADAKASGSLHEAPATGDKPDECL